MGRTREVSKILTSDTALATDVELAAVQNSLGLVSITPSSVAATGGSATISSSGAVSFTSASTISINDVFSATFKNYLIILSGTSNTNNAQVRLRMRASGADLTTSSYVNQFFRSLLGATAFGGVNTESFAFLAPDVGSPSNKFFLSEVSVYNPNTISNTALFYKNANSLKEVSLFVTELSVTNSFSGFSVIASVGEISGEIDVYGYSQG